MNKRINKWIEVKVLQTKWNSKFEDEFEFSDEEGYNTMKDRKHMLKDYRENLPQYEHRIITRKVINPEHVNKG